MIAAFCFANVIADFCFANVITSFCFANVIAAFCFANVIVAFCFSIVIAAFLYLLWAPNKHDVHKSTLNSIILPILAHFMISKLLSALNHWHWVGGVLSGGWESNLTSNEDNTRTGGGRIISGLEQDNIS